MTKPIEQQIVEALKARLQAIRVADGFHTDAGLHVYLGREIDEEVDLLPCIVVWPGQPAPGVGAQAPGLVPRTLPLIIEGIVQRDGDDPLVDIIQIARDIKRAIYLLDDRRLVPADCDDLVLGEDGYVIAESGRHVASAEVSISIPYYERFAPGA